MSEECEFKNEGRKITKREKPVPQDEIVERPKRFGERVSNDFTKKKITEKKKLKIGKKS